MMSIFLSAVQLNQGKIILNLIKTVFIFGQGENSGHIVCFHCMVICLHFLQKCKLSYLFTVGSDKEGTLQEEGTPRNETHTPVGEVIAGTVAGISRVEKNSTRVGVIVACVVVVVGVAGILIWYLKNNTNSLRNTNSSEPIFGHRNDRGNTAIKKKE